MKNISFVIAILSVIWSCTKDVGKRPVVCNTPAAVSYSNDVQKLFDQNCNTAGCHSGSSPAGGLNLEASVSYSELMQSGSGYIDTINPNYSLLYAQMNSASNPMPPSGKLSSCKLDLIMKWIQQKAKKN